MEEKGKKEEKKEEKEEKGKEKKKYGRYITSQVDSSNNSVFTTCSGIESSSLQQILNCVIVGSGFFP